MGNRVHALQGVESKLIVQVVEQADGEQVSPELGPAQLGHRGLDSRGKGLALHDQGQGRAEHDRDDGGVRVQGRTAEVLDVRHRLLAQHRPEPEGQVAEHGAKKAKPVERQLAGADHSHAEDDGNQGTQNREGRRRSEDGPLQHGTERRLQCLDGVRERDCDSCEGQVRSNVSKRMHGRRSRYLLELLPRDRSPERRLLEAQPITHQAVDRAHDNVDRAHRPWERETLVERLVGQVEAHVHRVPQCYVSRSHKLRG
mmetsp:Transcript_4603/g.13725  ORF Transcript_4603/g.13725 Transcript_4603/m.13725 type:complete len:256 (-) Transcript_4603:218-985(-)